MKPYQKAGSGLVVALFFAVALTGVQTNVVGIHQQCTDGADNDNDTAIDASDLNCWNYPFEDGGGEYLTTTGPTGKAWSSDSYSMSLFEYRLTYGAHEFGLGGLGENHCFDQTTQQAEYDQVSTDSGGKDSSSSEYASWFVDNCN